MKALTVIVPAYDMADWLPRALASLEPPPPSLEVIVVNDGSRDGTSAIAHDWAARHPGTCRVIEGCIAKENLLLRGYRVDICLLQ